MPVLIEVKENITTEELRKIVADEIESLKISSSSFASHLKYEKEEPEASSKPKKSGAAKQDVFEFSELEEDLFEDQDDDTFGAKKPGKKTVPQSIFSVIFVDI